MTEKERVPIKIETGNVEPEITGDDIQVLKEAIESVQEGRRDFNVDNLNPEQKERIRLLLLGYCEGRREIQRKTIADRLEFAKEIVKFVPKAASVIGRRLVGSIVKSAKLAAKFGYEAAKNYFGMLGLDRMLKSKKKGK